MKEFGVTSEEAYNLIAQGSQQGLNYSGELLDSITEYSVQFKKAGMDAEDMFNIMLSGAQDGAFNLDKVGDAVKEFNIRLVDGSKTTADGLKSLGLDANQVAKDMSSGGEKAQKTYYKLTEALANMKDKQQQNIVGVQLFGTMWEDLGPQVVGSLQNMNDSFNRTIPTMQKLNEVKYNDLGSAITGIGRSLQTGITKTVTESVLPKLNELANKIQQNMPEIQQSIKSAIDVAVPLVETLGKMIGFVIDNSNICIPVIAGLAGAIGTLKVISAVSGLIDLWTAATKTCTIAQWALNVALDANPIGLVCLAIGGLIAAGVALYQNWDFVKAKSIELWGWIGPYILEAIHTILVVGLGPLGDGIWKAITNFDAFKLAVSATMNGISDYVGNKVEWVRNTLNKMFNLDIPHIKMPHFNITGSLSLNPPQVPSLNVDWYSDGAIFTQPTLLGGIGVGDANKGFGSNSEAVLPLNILWNELSKNFDKLEQRLKSNNKEQVIYVTNITQLDGREIARTTEKYINNRATNKNIGRGILSV